MHARSLHLLVNWLVFAVCYPLTNSFAARGGVTRHIVFSVDHAIPFLPWMALPYMSSGLLLVLGFLRVPSPEGLRALSARLLVCTVVASLVFVAWPLQCSVERPVTDGLPATLFALLARVDQPFNQFPSLHVAYCVVLWPTLRSSVPRTLLAGVLMVVALSTLFTYQHHVIDVAGGLLLGLAAILVVRPGVALHYALGAGVLLVVARCLEQWWLLYGVISLLLIARAYACKDAHFLRKRDGRFPLASWVLYAPYLLGYWLTWQAVRWRERHTPPIVELAPGFWVGRRLSEKEARLLPAECAVIDLANELAETPCLRGARYHHVALLDLAPVPPHALIDAITLIRAAGRPVYLHCAMGYSRSILVAKKYQEGHADDALDLPA